MVSFNETQRKGQVIVERIGGTSSDLTLEITTSGECMFKKKGQSYSF